MSWEKYRKEQSTKSVPIEKEVTEILNMKILRIIWKNKNDKCLSFNKNYSNKVDEEIKKRFKNTFKFSNNDINKFILLLKKGVYPYNYIDEWEKFNET